MTENNKELKACPFCGGEPLYELNSEDDTIIVCQKCGAGAAPSVWCARHNEAPTGEIDKPPVFSAGNIRLHKTNCYQDNNSCKYGYHFSCPAKPKIKPTGEIGELIERIDDTLKYSEIWYKKAEGGLIPVPAGAIAINIRLFNSCKAHLQQAQKMSEALVNIRNDINNLKPETITRIIKQALNNKG